MNKDSASSALEILAALRVIDEESMAALGAACSAVVAAGDVIRLEGPLGAGKTVFGRGFVQASLPKEEVPSPTFALVQIYDRIETPIWHFDLYRLETPDDIWELGLEEALEQAVSLVEWPENGGSAIPANSLTIQIAPLDEGVRKVTITCAAEYSSMWRPRIDASKISMGNR